MKVLLIEDDSLIGDGIVAGLKKFTFIVEWISDGLKGLDAILSQKYDVIILDLSLPSLDGLEILSKAREKNIKTPIIILTARDAISQRVEGLNKGADDYLCKPFSLSELHARINALIRRFHNETKEFIEFKDLKLFIQELKVTKNDENIEMSTKEIQILKLFMLNKNVVLSRDIIMENLYEWDKEINSNTVDVFIHSLRKKIGNSYIKTIYGAGYRLE